MGIVIRAARGDDLPSIYRLLDAAFGDAPVELFINQTEGDSTMTASRGGALHHVRVAEVDGRIAAHVRIFARRMLVRGVPVRVGGIGSVASAPDARGLGLPSALLNDCIDVMTRERHGAVVSVHRDPGVLRAARVAHRAASRTLRRTLRKWRRCQRRAEYGVRRIEDGDVSSLLAIYRRGIAGSTGAIARTERTWRDAQAWLGEDPAGCLLAEHDGRPVAYLRARSREYGYNILEAEHVRGHEAAVGALLARAAKRGVAPGQQIVTTAPSDSSLAALLRSLRSTRETTDVRYPAMMRIVSLDALVTALLPHARCGSARARRHSVYARAARARRAGCDDRDRTAGGAPSEVARRGLHTR